MMQSKMIPLYHPVRKLNFQPDRKTCSLNPYETEYEELHHEKLDLIGFNSVEELLKNLYLNLVEVVDRLGTGIIRHIIRQPY